MCSFVWGSLITGNFAVFVKVCLLFRELFSFLRKYNSTLMSAFGGFPSHISFGAHVDDQRLRFRSLPGSDETL